MLLVLGCYFEGEGGGVFFPSVCCCFRFVSLEFFVFLFGWGFYLSTIELTAFKLGMRDTVNCAV